MVKSRNGFPGIYNIWRWRWVEGNKGIKACYGNKINELSKLKFLWNGQDPQARLRICRTCVFPLATYMAVRFGHLEKQLYKELMLLK